MAKRASSSLSKKRARNRGRVHTVKLVFLNEDDGSFQTEHVQICIGKGGDKSAFQLDNPRFAEDLGQLVERIVNELSSSPQ